MEYNNLRLGKTSLLITVRFSECDPYHIAHHSNFFNWFEMARLHFMKQNSHVIENFKNNQYTRYITLKTKCKFINSVRYEDEIKINTKMKLLDVPNQHSFSQEMINAKTGEKLAKCEALCGMIL